MAYSESKELTDTEKRLQALKIQLFGKERRETAITINPNHKSSVAYPSTTITISSHQHQDLTYLKKDLLKIMTLAMIALLVQLILYMQFTLKILKFN